MDFTPHKDVILYEGDDNIGLSFYFKQTSSATSNSGWLPYGTNISSAQVDELDSSGVDTTGLVYNATISIATDQSIDGYTADKVSFKVKHPAVNGRFGLKFKLTLNDGTIKHAIFKRLICKELDS